MRYHWLYLITAAMHATGILLWLLRGAHHAMLYYTEAMPPPASDHAMISSLLYILCFTERDVTGSYRYCAMTSLMLRYRPCYALQCASVYIIQCSSAATSRSPCAAACLAACTVCDRYT